MMNNINTELTTEIVRYLPPPDVCRAARVSRKFRDAWNTSRVWAEKFLALPYGRIARSLTTERFRFFHPAAYFPRHVDRILAFLSLQDTATVAFVDRTLRFLAYTHPQIKSTPRAQRQRYLAIECPQVSLCTKIQRAANAAERWVLQVQQPGTPANTCLERIFWLVGPIFGLIAMTITFACAAQLPPIKSLFTDPPPDPITGTAHVSNKLVECAQVTALLAVWVISLAAFAAGSLLPIMFAYSRAPVHLSRQVAKLAMVLQFGLQSAMQKVRVMARSYLS